MIKKFYQFTVTGMSVSLEDVSKYRMFIAIPDMQYRLEFQFVGSSEFISMGDKTWNMETYLSDCSILRKMFRVAVSDNFLEKEREVAERANKYIAKKQTDAENRRRKLKDEADKSLNKDVRTSFGRPIGENTNDEFFNRMRKGGSDTGPL